MVQRRAAVGVAPRVLGLVLGLVLGGFGRGGFGRGLSVEGMRRGQKVRQLTKPAHKKQINNRDNAGYKRGALPGGR